MAMKWLRKHNKKIMVVGGALLMLAFLMPRQGGCSRGPRMPDRAVAQAFGRKIMLSEYYGGQLEHRALKDAGLGIPVADPLDYVLLVREALRHRSITSTVIYARCDVGRLRETVGAGM